ncbi:MAG: TetR/AcrR family transcriptional regulator [Ktedonobacteraceae bacterium]|nr:TetR/AcrR family transcriptional regulator [Ktedonobacteraceae bacterium]
MKQTPTRDRILNAAVELFNTQRVSDVSTNHIAAAAGISPGNLYYHFRNKEEIIRAIYQQQMEPTWETMYRLPANHPPTLADLEQLVRENFHLAWRYRFFYRELLTLLHHDPLLRELYSRRRKGGIENTRALLLAFARARILQPPPEPGLTELVHMLWLITEFWGNFIELDRGEITAEGFEEGIQMLWRALAPYMQLSHEK